MKCPTNSGLGRSSLWLRLWLLESLEVRDSPKLTCWIVPKSSLKSATTAPNTSSRRTDLPTWLNKHEKHEHEHGKRLAQGALQGCANRSVETRPFPLLTGGGEVSITAAEVPLSGHTPGTLMLASGWDPDLEPGLGPGIPPPPFLPWGFQSPRQSPRHFAPLKPHKKGHASLSVAITMM